MVAGSCRVWTHHPHPGRRLLDKLRLRPTLKPTTQTTTWDGSCLNGKAHGKGKLTHLWDGVPLYSDRYTGTNGGLMKNGVPRLNDIPLSEFQITIEECNDNGVRTLEATVPSSLDLSNYPLMHQLGRRIEEEGNKRCPPPDTFMWQKATRIYQLRGDDRTLIVETHNLTATDEERAHKHFRGSGISRFAPDPLTPKLTAGLKNYVAVMHERRVEKARAQKRTFKTILWSILATIVFLILFRARYPILQFVHYVFVPHPAKRTIDRATRGANPAPLDANRLAKDVRPSPAQSTDPPASFVSRNMARKANQLRQKAEARRQRYQAEARLTEEAIEMERARRRRNDERGRG